jgi:hypothetical protein
MPMHPVVNAQVGGKTEFGARPRAAANQQGDRVLNA